MASCSTSTSEKKGTDSNGHETQIDQAALVADARAYFLKKCKGSIVTVRCTCDDARKFRLRLGRLCPDVPPPEEFLDTAFQVFAQERDKGRACKYGIKRTREKCSCEDSYNQRMSLFPPYDRPFFPTNDEIVGAELDWLYEAEKCLYCAEHGGIEGRKFQYRLKKDNRCRSLGNWV